MARSVIDPVEIGKTTVVTPVFLLDRMGIHVKKNRDNQTDFMTRAIINQMEKEGDFSIRQEMEELTYG